MKSCFFFVLCILIFVSPQDAVSDNSMLRSATSSPTRSPIHTTVAKSSGKVPTTYRSHSVTASSTRSQKKRPSYTTVPKSSGKRPTTYPITPTSSPKTPTIGTISQKPVSPSSRGSYPTSTKAPKSSPPPASTTANSTTSQNSTGTSSLPVVSASGTLTVSNGQTASAQVGWVVVGAGIGGFVAVGGIILPVEGDTAVIIEENNSGQDELSTISHSDTQTSTTPTTSSVSTTSTSTTTSRSTRSTSRSTSSSSTSSSTASPTPYNIYPKLDSTPPQQTAFTEDLERIAQPGSVRRITGGRDQLLLWVASLTPAQASELSRNPTVRGLNVDRSLRVNLERPTRSASSSPPSPNCESQCSHQKRDGTILMQQDARDDLKVLSQARGARSLSGLPGYAYDARGGREITVYVIDTGINPEHPEFRDMQGRIRWLYLPDEPQIEGDENGHGTCVASKVASPTFGVAKSANIVMVKLPPINNSVNVSRYIAALAVIARDIASKNLQTRSVISTTLSVGPNRMTENDRTTFIEGMRNLIDLDAVLVVASGNIHASRPGLALATYPALLASQLPIVVVGAVELPGIYARYSQGLASELTVSGVGKVFCAWGQGTSEVQGTSFAAPAVAGLAAYLMSLDRYRVQLLVPGSVARNVRDLIKSLAYARVQLQPAVVWNGIDSREIYYCPVRRDAGSSGCPARNTTIPIVPPAAAASSSNPPPPSTTVGTSTTMLTSTGSSNSPTSSIMSDTLTTTVISSSNSLSSSIATDSLTTSNGGGESPTLAVTLTISIGETVTITLEGSVGRASVEATNAPQALHKYKELGIHVAKN